MSEERGPFKRAWDAINENDSKAITESIVKDKQRKGKERIEAVSEKKDRAKKRIQEAAEEPNPVDEDDLKEILEMIEEVKRLEEERMR